MNGALLVAALATPLVGALVAVLVPSGEARPGRTHRRKRRVEEATTGPPAAGDAPVPAVPSGERRRPLRRKSRAEEAAGGVAARPPPPPPEPDPERRPDPAAAERAGATARLAVRVAALVAAGLWTLVTVLGGADAGPLSGSGAIGPAAAGAALMLAAVHQPARRRPAAAGALALTLLSGGLALAAGGDRAVPAMVALAAGAVVIALVGRDDRGLGIIAVALAGLAAIAGGLSRLVSATDSFALPATGEVRLGTGLLLLGGAAAVAVAGGLRPRRTAGLLLPVGLALGVPAAAALGSAGDVMAIVLAAAAAATVAAWASLPQDSGGGVRLLVAALALASLAAAAVDAPGIAGTTTGLADVGRAGVPGAWLLAAAALVTAVTLVPVAALAAIPGMAALTVVLVADPEPAHLAVVALLAATAAIAVAARDRLSPDDGERDEQEAGDRLGPLAAGIPALAAGAWLLVAPGTWTWAGEAALEGWSRSVAVAVAAGLIGAVAAGATGRVAVPSLPCLAAPDPAGAGDGGGEGGARRLTLAAGLALGLALVALVVSSAHVT